MLEIKDVVKSFTGNIVLDKINFSINNSSVFGLVGTNGAGKSTLLRLIAGVYKPDSGSLYFNGSDTYTDAKIRKDIFYVSDYPYYPFGNNLANLKNFYTQFYNLNLAEYERLLGVFELNQYKPFNALSKGTKRKASLLLALAIKPKLLLLDEAFDGLDPLVRFQFKKEVITLLEEGSSVIISSHSLKELEDICDSFGLLQNGKLKTSGDLLASKANIAKYQVAFTNKREPNDFSHLDVLKFSQEGSVYTLVIKGNKEEISQQLLESGALFCDIFPINFEELFIYEVGRKN